MDGDPTVDRRELLRAAGAGVAAPAGIGAGATGVAAAQAGRRHVVATTDRLVFDPDGLTVAPGDTVVWENVGSVGHSVTAYEDRIPADADSFASGGFDTEAAARRAYAVGDPASDDVVGGASFEHAFEREGVYDYFCIPHETLGMVARIDVVPGGAPEPTPEEALPAVPDAARAIALGVTAALATVAGLAYVLLKYGGDFGPADGDDGR